jgi:hypothetical protein
MPVYPSISQQSDLGNLLSAGTKLEDKRREMFSNVVLVWPEYGVVESLLLLPALRRLCMPSAVGLVLSRQLTLAFPGCPARTLMTSNSVALILTALAVLRR